MRYYYELLGEVQSINTLMKKTKLEDNCNILKEQIKEHTNFNRARIFVIVGLIVSISKLRAVNLKKLATVLNATLIH